jgi:predicted aminopeptidase
MRTRIPATLFAALASCLLASCYVTEQGMRYISLLSRAVPFRRILDDPAASATIKALVERAAAARAFALSALGLADTRNYTKIVELDSDRLATVVQACAELSFERHLWNYPLVGRLPYRGYFEPAEAEQEGARLREFGLDVIVRPVAAFSTLGALADPLFSFMADYGEAETAELIIHEMTHATVFLKGRAARSVPGAGEFNEELATFVGREGSLRWLASVHGESSPELEAARAARRDAEAFSAWMKATALDLEAVYASDSQPDEKRSCKAQIIAERAAAFEKAYDGLFTGPRYRGFRMDKINNAYLDLYRLYEGESELYGEYLQALCDSDLRRFVSEMSRVARGAAAGRRDPREIMREEIRTAERIERL